jgi:C4-dicarboxylate-binding protein DctP
MPFLFPSAESTYKVTRGPIGDKLAENSKKNGVKILATGVAGGMRNITNNKRPITSPEDMKGLKLRTPPWEVTIKTMEALGANPVSIAYSETYMALKTGVADGEENPWIYITTPKFHEVQKYATVVNWNFTPEVFYVNLDWFESLSAEYQEVLVSVAKKAIVSNDAAYLKQQKEAEQLCRNSMEVIELTQEARQEFVDTVKPVYDYYIDKGLFTWDDVNEIKEAIK